MRSWTVSLLVSCLLVAGAASAQRKPTPPPPAPPPSGAPGGELPIDVQLFRVISDGCKFGLVEQKLVKGADPNSTATEANLSVKVGENALIGALRRKCNEKTIEALATGQVPSGINVINVKKADIEATGLDGVTPLVLAVQTGDPSLVRRLMKAGADANHKMSSTDRALNGKTAFDFVDGQKHEKRLRRILKKDWDD